MSITESPDTIVRRSSEADAIFFAPIQHLLIHVSGVVQGVGFRPFVFRLAQEYGLCGSVRNNHGGVIIHAEGTEENLRLFLRNLQVQAPEVSKVTRVDVSTLPLSQPIGFHILESDTDSQRLTPVSVDLALCDDCRRELFDPGDRRYRYPFINCTNCGPRFTIIRGVPYDRPLTTMTTFQICDECAAEYLDPRNRRFHAEPVACPHCGPQLKLLSMSNARWCSSDVGEKALNKVIEILRNGGIVLIQGIGGFHLACDARSDRAVSELRSRKNREEKPFAVMFPSRAALDDCCEVSEMERDLLTSVIAPIVLLRKKADLPISEAVAPRNPLLGCLLPYSPLHLLLLHDFGGPLVMTSANASDEPICYDTEDALVRAGKMADAALVHDRPIHTFADDSVVRIIKEQPRVWRRARGYVPASISTPLTFRAPVLAFGADLKNTFCLARDSTVILSQHIGDMESAQSAVAHRAALEHYLHLFGSEVGVVACDLHPDYATTAMAEEWSAVHGVPLVRTQHHHAHLASCLAENGSEGPAIGLCLDGTGYGTDGTIWGGEVLLGDYRTFERIGHLKPIPMPGGELAARQPWRTALAWLHESFGETLFDLKLRLMDDLRGEYDEFKLRQLLNADLMAYTYPRTSSAGRLFDAVVALVCFGTRHQYEGQAAMELEALIASEFQSGYTFDLNGDGGTWLLSPVPMFRELVSDLQNGVSAGIIARRFHEGLTQGFAKICHEAAAKERIRTVALSGGCFQNAFLLTQFEHRLHEAGLEVLTHREVPTNDGGIALGQACIANANGGS